MKDAGRQVPNRMLWSMFLCLTRARIAMSYPPWGSVANPIERESISPATAPLKLIHDDLHDENIMLGGLSHSDLEHRLAPILKPLDFGKAAQNPGADIDSAVKRNIQDIGKIMTTLVMRVYAPWAEQDVVVNVRDAQGLAVPLKVYTHPRLDEVSHISTDLKDLIFRCQSVDAQERPSLEELLQLCGNAVNNSVAQDYRGIPGYSSFWETDEAIRDLEQRVLLDADTVPATGRRRSLPGPQPATVSPNT
ncbi:Uu.00g121070.m01.CDS01 [Anthostomella pinea]|uniref:Uu.00g121070.m01.CDS01 n=1 Tax=Anthostomella pinea TaxID=933095 RepID=A0AAI8VGZ3_9PEZI|nr:Uu.00g121070.m01.CDS01 [Anthostomella pinea]